MFTCAKIKNGRTYLGKHLTANDYYTENERVSGKWIGLAAERLTEINFVSGDCKNLPTLPGMWVFCPHFSRIYGQNACVPQSIPKVLQLFLTKLISVAENGRQSLGLGIE